MKTNNKDIPIRDKFKSRTFKPSESAWQRLSDKLDEKPKEKKKGWVFYAGIAASILVLVSIGFGVFSSDENQFQPKNEMVVSPIDTSFINIKLNEIRLENELNEAVVEVEKPNIKEEVISKEIRDESAKNKSVLKENKTIVTSNVDETLRQTHTAILEKNNIKSFSNSSIKVNANDLLFAVTHNEEEVVAYYAKNNIDRKKLLQSIEDELKKSNIKVDANSVLAEVEQNINEDTFKNNFLQMIKKKVSDVTSAVASRNN